MSNPLDQYRDSHREFQQDVSVELNSDPFIVFSEWFKFADESKELEANAFVLGTSTSDHQSSTRIVYLKEILDHQFVFYTNYLSQKGREIAANPKVSMLFFYPGLSRQIRIEGICTKVDEMISDAYFESRPRGSQIGAWASHQSEVLNKSSDLEERIEQLEKRFPNKVPRPEQWGGYQIEPTRFEFWMGRKSRLHERIVFEPQGDAWKIYRKNP